MCFKESLLIVVSNFLKSFREYSIILFLVKLLSMNPYNSTSNLEMSTLNSTQSRSNLLIEVSSRSCFLFLSFRIMESNFPVNLSMSSKLCFSKALNCCLLEKMSINF